MIARLMGEGQFRLPDEAAERLNELDNAAVELLEAGDEEGFRAKLEELARAVRERGEPLDYSELSASDVVVPPADLTLEEARELFQGEGLIPDLPSR